MLQKKLKRLQDILSKMKSVLVAYSGGVDSSLLLKVAKDVLGRRVLAVTASSPTYPKNEINQAKKIARKLRVKHSIVKTHELKNSNFVRNPINRCYFCKKELFENLTKIAKKEGLKFVVDGSNLDDEKDYRPGTLALKEFKVRSPLKEAGLTKQEIRKLSKNLQLPTWDKPAFACLASRFPYNLKINSKDLRKVQTAEKIIANLGIRLVRVRHHDSLARIEVTQTQIHKIIKNRKSLIAKLKKCGYNYICVDLEGYRSGSLNEVLF